MCYPFGSVPGGCTHRIPSEFHGDMYYSIDVECVATGTDHNSRSVAQISLVVRGRWNTSMDALKYVKIFIICLMSAESI